MQKHQTSYEVQPTRDMYLPNPVKYNTVIHYFNTCTCYNSFSREQLYLFEVNAETTLVVGLTQNDHNI